MRLVSKFRRRMVNPFFKKRIKDIAFGTVALIIIVMIYVTLFSLMTK